MKILIVEDDFTSRLLLQELLKSYGQSHIAVNGVEAVKAVNLALDAGKPYDLICMDIMMPEMDGQEALKKIRSLEETRGVLPEKIIMITGLGDKDNVMAALRAKCDGFLIKPLQKSKLMEELRKLKLIS